MTMKPTTADGYPPELADEARRMLLYVATILGESHRDRRGLTAPLEPGLEALRKKTEARIRDVLRPDQLPAFDAFAEHLAERHRRGFPPPGFPPPPAPPRGE